ncbi:MAG: glutamate-1-semialdehyde 2,1-aminomutase [Deltaproteobacteria bacterium]|nr:glutamate-1-semialdehyde 2,1-aminomutase [Deltaproteobacteria bacterium]
MEDRVVVRRVGASEALFAKAKAVIPGGVNSPVRAYRAVGGVPPFVAEACGAEVVDADGNRYVDYVMSWGALIAGHAEPSVVAAVQAAAARGTSFGAPTAGEVELAAAITRAFPAVERVRLVSSGTEAVMSALRVARAATKRDVVVKFDGHYHGHSDAMLVNAGSGLATFGVPSSPGVPAALAALTVTLPFNNRDALGAAFRERGREIAAVIVEPVMGNMGVVPAEPGFLEAVRDETARAGAILIFDEVITGMRVGPGGAQTRFGVRPDLSCLGKIIGGGLPLAAFGGRADLMGLVAPEGPVYQAGTLSGNPVAVAAGIAMMKLLERNGVYDDLDRRAATLCAGVLDAARNAGIPLVANRVGSMFSFFFTGGAVRSAADARRADAARFARFHAGMLERGFWLAPSAFEAWFLSLAHTDEHVARTVTAANEVFRSS